MLTMIRKYYGTVIIDVILSIHQLTRSPISDLIMCNDNMDDSNLTIQTLNDLLERGASVNEKDKSERTLLHKAAECGICSKFYFKT